MHIPSQLALSVAVAVAVAQPAAAETIQGEGYTVDVSTPAGAAPARLIIRPTGAWKLNEEYPFKVTIRGTGAAPDRASLGRGDVKLDARRAEVAIGYTVSAATGGALDVVLRFGTCDDRSCAAHKQAVRIPVAAR